VSRYLLDTHTFLWWLKNSDKLGVKVREEISNPDNNIYVSAASIWEISIKKAIGKLEAPSNLTSIVKQKGFDQLPITLEHGEGIGELPDIHKDPFDRILVVQAQKENLIIVTNDRIIPKYKVNTLSTIL
jgi:PIN domain nuclease of toxin-antitoxin system